MTAAGLPLRTSHTHPARLNRFLALPICLVWPNVDNYREQPSWSA